jgi:hypothetical protein
MILSVAISALAGIGFLSMAASDDPTFTSIAGYATLGAIFYLVSARRLSGEPSADRQPRDGAVR